MKLYLSEVRPLMKNSYGILAIFASGAMFNSVLPRKGHDWVGFVVAGLVFVVAVVMWFKLRRGLTIIVDENVSVSTTTDEEGS